MPHPDQFQNLSTLDRASKEAEEANKRREEREKYNSPEAQANRLKETRESFKNESIKEKELKVEKRTADSQKAAQLRNQIDDLLNKKP